MQTIYIGESKRKYDLQRNRVYTERPEKLITELSAKYPLIKHLFVPITEIGKAQELLTKAGSIIYTANVEVGGEK